MAAPQVVRYKIGKNTFEILTNEGSVLKFRDGKIDWQGVPYTDEVYKNQSKGDRATFGTDDIKTCMQTIVEKGDLQVSSKERQEQVEKKRAEIVNYIHKYYTDPKTKTPHPVLRIENALTTLKIRVDPETPAERQAQDIVKKMPEVLPIKKSVMEGTLFVPHSVIGPAQGVIQQWSTVQRENYDDKGCTMEVSIIPGDYDQFMVELNKVSKGEHQFNILGQESAPSGDSKGKKGKGKGTKGKNKNKN